MNTDNPFSFAIEPVAAASLFENVYQQLRGAIQRGEAAPGSRLPSEAEMTARFGVSRTVIREAVAHLRAEGLVVAHQGKGVFVTAQGSANVLRFSGARIDAESLAQLFELRAIVEIGAAELAARHRRPSDIAELKRAIGAMRRAIDDGDAGGAEADVAFHYAIARATGNPYFGEVLEFLRGRFRDAIRDAWANSRATGHGPDPAFREHERLYAAIEAGDVKAAGRAARIHLDNAAARLGFQRGKSKRLPTSERGGPRAA